MKFELIKDIVISCLILVTDIFMFSFPVFLPYIYSFLKSENETLTFTQCYSLIFFCYFGSIVANIILPKCFFIFGVRVTFVIGAIINMVNTVFILNFPGMYSLLPYGFFNGMVLNFKTVPINFYFSVKYENGTQYLGYSYGGQAFGGIVWSILLSLVVNPSNEQMNRMTMINGFKEYYYNENVVSRFKYFYFMVQLGTLIVTYVCCMLFMNDPKNCEGNVGLWFNAFIRKDENAKIEYEKRKHEFSNQQQQNLSKSLIECSQDQINVEDDQKEVEIEMLNKEEVKQPDDLQQEIRKELLSPKFIGFIFLTVIKNSGMTVMINDYKFISQIIIRNDLFVSAMYAIMSLADIFGRLLVSYTWKKYGFYYCHLFIIVYNIVFEILFILLALRYQSMFVVVYLFMGLSWAYSYLLGHITMFGLYRPQKAVGLLKLFDSYYILQALYGVIITGLFFNDFHIYKGLGCMIVLECIAGIIFYIFYKEFGDIKQHAN